MQHQPTAVFQLTCQSASFLALQPQNYLTSSYKPPAKGNETEETVSTEDAASMEFSHKGSNWRSSSRSHTQGSAYVGFGIGSDVIYIE
jgi:hypothetical protein